MTGAPHPEPALVARPRESTGRRLSAWLAGSGVLLLALGLRVWFLSAVVGPGDPRAWSCPDTASYRSMAESLLMAGNFQTGHPDIRVHALNRPPGYPLLLATVRALGLGDRTVLLMQVLCSVAAVAGVLFLTFWLTRRWAWSCGIALVAALSPTGLAAPSVLLTDSLFAFWLVVALVLAFGPGREREWLRALLFGLALVSALYVKPGLTYFLPLSLLWWGAGVLHRRARWSWRPVLLVLCVQVAGWGVWTARNAVVEGVAAFSKIGDAALAHYLAAQVTSIADDVELASLKTLKMAEAERAFRENPGRAAEVYAAMKAEARGVFREQPRITLGCFWQNIRENVSASWGSWRQQLGLGQEQPAPFLEALFAADGRWRGRLLWWSPVLLLPVMGFRLWRQGRTALPFVLTALAALGTSAYFALISGVTFWTGSRIVFPAESSVLLSYALLLARPTPPDEESPCPTPLPQT